MSLWSAILIYFLAVCWLGGFCEHGVLEFVDVPRFSAVPCRLVCRGRRCLSLGEHVGGGEEL
jgi:hypothetical protein